MSSRSRIHAALFGKSDAGLSRTQRLLVGLIVASTALTIVGTEAEIAATAPTLFAAGEYGFGILFLIEYLVRLWCIGEDPRYTGLRGRWRYAREPLAVIDLAAALPFLLGVVGAEALVLRLVRLLRLLVLAKLSRYSRALRLLRRVVAERRYELGFTAMVALLVMTLAAAALYLVEGEAQPEHFGSIPRAMWWAVATLTTVGYGDAYPVTPLGRLLGAMTAFAGVGLIAMPTGILAAALADALARARSEGSDGDPRR